MGFIEQLERRKEQIDRAEKDRKEAEKQTAEIQRQARIAASEEAKRQRALLEEYARESGLLGTGKKPDKQEALETLEEKKVRLGEITGAAMFYDKKLKLRSNRYVKRVAGSDFKTIAQHDQSDMVLAFENWRVNYFGHFYQSHVFGVVIKPTGEISFHASKEGSSTLSLDQWRANPSLVEEALGKAYSNPKLIEYWKA